ncbi:hypothetical protein B8X02_17675 [Stenotrophomonas rhizophila]|uniref:hypothetical protein n=1 Tax=Stenotrophomonas rhizophila TaxID=216778 RepID=UPI000BA64D81|nr:hypothetical protein [Stenotrophomonas rhizophila]PAK89416.1 hypothetical protein B8X02_17675 [Stenotrophomonas rhizophila]
MVDYEDIRSREAQLFVLGRRFGATIWINSPDDVEVRGLTLETGEVLPALPNHFPSQDAALEAARNAVSAWLELPR